MNYTKKYLMETRLVLRMIDEEEVEEIAQSLSEIRRRGGRLFILGVGGSAANASHAVNDFRKLARIEAYAPTDNVAELTARINDDGWGSCFSGWFKASKLNHRDAVLVFSVGGGSDTTSTNIVNALDYAQAQAAYILGIVGRDGGYTAKVADYCVVIPPRYEDRITPHTEGITGILWHLIVSHPLLK